MASSSIGKRQREQAKKAKADAKRQRRQHNLDAHLDEEPCGEAWRSVTARESTEDLLATIAELHRQRDAGTVTFDDFEAQKADLLARLVVD